MAACSSIQFSTLRRSQGNFSQEVFVQRLMGLGSLVERKRARDMDHERRVADQLVQPGDAVRLRHAVIILDFNSLTSLWGRVDAVGICGSSAFANGSQCLLRGFTTSGNQGAINAAGRELPGLGQNIFA